MLSPKLYETYLGKKRRFELAGAPYGYHIRGNFAGQREKARDPDSEISIFDTCCFNFYLVKYVEVIGIEPLIAILGEQKADERN